MCTSPNISWYRLIAVHLQTHLAPSRCTLDMASADHCAWLNIITYLQKTTVQLHQFKPGPYPLWRTSHIPVPMPVTTVWSVPPIIPADTTDGVTGPCGAILGRYMQPKPSRRMSNSTNDGVMAAPWRRMSRGVVIETRHFTRVSNTGPPLNAVGRTATSPDDVACKCLTFIETLAAKDELCVFVVWSKKWLLFCIAGLFVSTHAIICNILRLPTVSFQLNDYAFWVLIMPYLC